MSKDNHIKAKELYDQGKEYYDSGFPEKTIPCLERLLKDYSELIHLGGVNYLLGMSYFNQDKLELAKICLETALKHLDSNKNGFNIMDILYHLGIIYFENNQLEISLHKLEEANNFIAYYDNPEWYDELFEYWCLRGNINSSLGYYCKTFLCYEKAERLIDGSNPLSKQKISNINFLKSRSLFYQEKFESSIENLSNVNLLYLEERFKQSYYYIKIRLYLELKKYNKLILEFKKYSKFGISEENLAEVYNFTAQACVSSKVFGQLIV